ncbi:MAG: signal transduction histidine kinase [Paracoccaceae bacterium]
MLSKLASGTDPEYELPTSLRILIVDDSEADAMLFREIVRDVGTPNIGFHHCFGFKDGLAALRADVYDIAFVDYRLGADSGTDLIRAAGGRSCTTPLVLLTGQFGWVAERQGITAGAVDCVDKNIMTPDVLRRVIGYAQNNHGTARSLVLNLESYRDLAQSAVRANAEKSLFFAEMSHELRTPLNAIVGFSEILKNEMMGPFGKETTERYAGYADDIHVSSQHLLSLINDLLDLSKFDAGAYDPQMVRASVSDLLGDLLKIMGGQAIAAGIDLSIDVAENLPDPVIDKRLILQALLNVLSNAIKFTEDGGSITVAARVAESRLVVSVVDTGCGIGASDIDFVLLPYRQGSPMEARPGGGTGLGLAVTQSIVDIHGGHVTVDSKEGEGTTVTLFLRINLQ